MATFSSEDGLYQLSERFDTSYSLSADVSESDSSSAFSYERYEREGASSSLTLSSVAGPEFEENSGFTAPVHVLLPVVDGRHVVIPTMKIEKPKINLSEVEMIKERFAKLLLGEDMSGGGKGVCTALAISNAITNLSATVFGELWKLEPLAPQKKSMWHREMDWLLCVSDAIVVLTPSSQQFPGGGSFEVMVSRPRQDLCINLPALKKLDAMLISILDGFRDSEFYYVDRGIIVNGSNQNESYTSSFSFGRPSIRQEEKWWLPFPKVSASGLSEETRKRLQNCRNSASQILQAALAINSGVLAEMEIPNAYLESLPKTGKACLGEIMYSYITDEQFSPDFLLDYSLDLSSEYTALDVANGIEAALQVWKQKYQKQGLLSAKSRKPSWGGKVKNLMSDMEKGKILVYRAESLLQNLKQRFPGLPQTALDMSKIQYNQDVGQSILESYSRVMESLAFNIIARIDDLLFVDEVTKDRATPDSPSSPYEQKLRSRNSISARRLCDTPLTALSSVNTGSTGKPWRRTCHVKKENSMDELRERLARFSFS